jgi:hypothetical protein
MDVQIECICPRKADGEPRHAHDKVTLRERLSFRAALTCRNAVAIVKREDPDAGTAEILAVMTEHYVLEGIESWSLVDAKGKPVEVSRPAIRELILTNDEAAIAIANEADDLYQPQVLLPLLVRAQASSQPSPTDDSTSARTNSGPKSPKRSKRSSTSITQTAGIATITSLPDGGYSSLQNSASVE